jgi:hypothetical protein
MALGDTSLLFRIKGDATDAVRALNQTQREAAQLTTSASGLSAGLAGLAGPAALAATVVAGIGAAAIAVTSKLFDMSKAAADFGSAVFDASQKTGLSAETLSALKVAAEQSGSSFEGVTNAVAKFNVLLGNAANGNEKAEKILKQYGITATDTQGALEQAITAVAGMTSSSEQAAAAGALFKDRTGEILPVIKSFDGDLPGLIDKLRDLGVLMSDEDAKAADEFGDQMDTLNAQLDAVYRTIGFQVMPTFLKFANALSSWLSENKHLVRAWAVAIGDAFSLASKALIRLYDDGRRAFAVLRAISLLSQGPLNLGAAVAIIQSVEGQISEDQASRNRVSPTAGAAGRATRTFGGVDTTDSGGTKKTRTGDDRSDRQVYLDFVAELKKLGVTINSGFRTRAEQAALFAKLPPGQAARPGTSDHEFYKAVDLPAGVKREVLEQAARAAGVILAKQFVHQGTGLHNHQAFKKGVLEGGGEESILKENEDAQKKIEEEAKKAIDLERQTMAERLAIFESGQKRRAALVEEYGKEIGLNEEGILDLTAQLEAESLEERKRLLLDYIAVLEQAGEEGVEPLRKATLELKLLEDEIEINRADNHIKLLDRAAKEKEIQDERRDYWAEELGALREIGAEIDANIERRQEELDLERFKQEGELGEFAEGFFGELGGLSPISIFGDQDTLLSEADFIKNVWTDLETHIGGAIGSMVEGLSQMAAAWLVTGKFSAKAALQMAASVALSLAMQAGVAAVMELARGWAESAAAAASFAIGDFYGGTMHSTAAGLHFSAAAVYGTVAAVAGAVGVGLGLAGRAVGGGSGGGGGRAAQSSFASTTGYSNNSSAQGSYYSSFGDEEQVIEEGINQPSIRSEVVLRIDDRSGWFADMFQTEIGHNSKLRQLIIDTANA